MCERTKDDFTSVMQKSYTRKYGFRPEKAVHVSDYKDILAGPFTQYVVLNSPNQPELPFEDVHHCFNRLVKKHLKLKKILEKEPDEQVLALNSLKRGKTIYQLDYCDINDAFESKKSRARRQVNLPPDWGEIPATTQRASFRDPARLATWDLRPRLTRPKPSALQPNLKEREILKVETGQSEYEARIGVLGDMIMQDQLHGEPQDELQCRIYQQMLQAHRSK